MKKVLSLMLVLVLSASLFTSCKSDKEVISTQPDISETEDEKQDYPQYLNEKELYYYNDVYELLKKENNTDIARPIDIPCSTFELFSKVDEPQSLLHPTSKLTTFIDGSIGFPFIKVSANMHANPFNNFNILKKSKLIEAASSEELSVEFDFTDGTFADGGLCMEYNIPSVNLKPVKYNYSKSGCFDLLRNIHILESANYETDVYTKYILKYENTGDGIYFSRKDDCYYSYIMKYDNGYADVFAIYFKSSDGKYIDEVTSQLLYIDFPAADSAAGVSISLSMIDAKARLSHFSIFMAIEKALSGTCRYNDRVSISPEFYDVKYVLDESYEGKNYTAKAKKETYIAKTDDYPHNFDNPPEDHFTNYTYTIKLK